MMSAIKQQAERSAALVEETILTARQTMTQSALRAIYWALIRPPIVFESYFDLRANLVQAAIEQFSSNELAHVATEAVNDILIDLRKLMPTPEQIASSRSISTKRYASSAA